MKNPEWPSNRSVDGEPTHLYESNFYAVTKASFFDYDTNFFQVKITCPSEHFILKEVYDFTDVFERITRIKNIKFLIFHVTDNIGEQTLGLPISHFIEGKVQFDEIIDPKTCQPSNFDASNHQGVIIKVFNDDRADLCNGWDPFKYLSPGHFEGNRPEESGGGVVVGNP